MFGTVASLHLRKGRGNLAGRVVTPSPLFSLLISCYLSRMTIAACRRIVTACKRRLISTLPNASMSVRYFYPLGGG